MDLAMFHKTIIACAESEMEKLVEKYKKIQRLDFFSKDIMNGALCKIGIISESTLSTKTKRLLHEPL